MKKLEIKKFIPGIAWFFVVMIIMCMPGDEIPTVDWLTRISFDKIVHVGVFALLAILFCWPVYRSAFATMERLHYFIKVSIAVSIWGLVIEFIQKYFVPGRSFDLIDWAADSLGALIAYWICSKIFIQEAKA